MINLNYKLVFILFLVIFQLKGQSPYLNGIRVLSTGDFRQSYLGDFFSGNYINTLSFTNGDYLVSENGLYTLRQTADKKNMEIIQYQIGVYGDLEYVGKIWQSNRPASSYADFEGLKLQEATLSMWPKGIISNTWETTFIFERFVFLAQNVALGLSGLKIIDVAGIFYNVCSPKIIFTVTLSNTGQLLIEKHSRGLYCDDIKEKTVWSSADGYGRRLQSEKLKDHLIDLGLTVKDSPSIQVNEKLETNEIIISENEEFVFFNCHVWKTADFTEQNSDELEIEKININAVNSIPQCSNE